MLNFIENQLKLDASGLSIGSNTNNTIIANLTLDQRSIGTTSFPTIDIYDITNTNIITTNLPFDITLTKSLTQNCILQITLNKPLSDVKLNINRKVRITSNLGETFDLYIEINYANNFSIDNWVNSEEVISVDDIDFHGPFTSLSINNKLRALLSSLINSLNQARLNTKYYFFKDKYLSDIIEFAIEAGSTLENSSSSITYNSDGTISSILKIYNTGRNRTERIKITYNYATYSITRVQKRGAITTDLESVNTQLINSFKIEALDNTNAVIYTLGQIIINRNAIPTLYSVSYLKDYNNGLTPTDPDNIMADYKYYKTNTITGWTVIA